jgi:hypothetical protein
MRSIKIENFFYFSQTQPRTGATEYSRRTRIMLSMSGRFLPPQAEDEDEDEEAVETEQDADDEGVCRSIRPAMCRADHPTTHRLQPEGGRTECSRRRDGTQGESEIFCVFTRRPRLSCGCPSCAIEGAKAFASVVTGCLF